MKTYKSDKWVLNLLNKHQHHILTDVKIENNTKKMGEMKNDANSILLLTIKKKKMLNWVLVDRTVCNYYLGGGDDGGGKKWSARKWKLYSYHVSV